MISEIDIKDWEMSPETTELYNVPRNSVVSPVEDSTFLVDFKHVDGMYSLGTVFGTNDLTHLAAWTPVNIWRKKID
jgi:hypothetical protein